MYTATTTAIDFMVFSKKLITIGLLCLAVEGMKEKKVEDPLRAKTKVNHARVMEQIRQSHPDIEDPLRAKTKVNHARVMEQIRQRKPDIDTGGRFYLYTVNQSTSGSSDPHSQRTDLGSIDIANPI